MNVKILKDFDSKKNKNHKEEVKVYEHGAHFKHMDLFKELVNLVSTLPAERLGNNGIYFQKEDEDENKNNINSKKPKPLYLKILNNKIKLDDSNPKTQINCQFTPKNNISNFTIKFDEFKLFNKINNGASNNGYQDNFKLKVKSKRSSNQILKLPTIYTLANNNTTANNTIYSPKNLSSFKRYKMFSKFKPNNNMCNINHAETFAYNHKNRLKISIN